MGLTWQPTWGEGGPNFILVRTRDPSVDPESETIGRIMLFRPIGSSTDAWKWSLTSQARPVGFNKQGFPTSGSEDTQRGARDALVAAWSQEEAFRAEVRADPRFGEMSVYMRGFIENGQPTPAKWSRDPT